jgi:hypothetical protein
MCVEEGRVKGAYEDYIAAALQPSMFYDCPFQSLDKRPARLANPSCV